MDGWKHVCMHEWMDTQGTCIKTVRLYALCIVAFSSPVEGLNEMVPVLC